MNFIKNLYFSKYFYYLLVVVSVLFFVSFWLEFIYFIAWYIAMGVAIMVVVDGYLLFNKKNGIDARRILSEKFSNSDENPIPITLKNLYNFKVTVQVIDELPVQFQKRDFKYCSEIKGNQIHNFEYTVTPVERGEYYFGRLLVYVSSPLRIVLKRYQFQNEAMVAVYPSYIQMKKYEFLAISNKLQEFGLKKIRRIGHTLEFEQIKNYVIGDDVRTINWKATAKRRLPMVNQYQDEKSQPIYSIIDVSRAMKMPFENLKLLDYAINATLAFSNIALLKNDKAGMLSFSKKVDKIIAASNKKTHLNSINNALYNITTQFTDSDFGYLYVTIKRVIKQRSLLILYTNFEHVSGLNRQKLYLQAIAKNHLLLVVFFENTELDSLINSKATDLNSIYSKTVAEKFAFEKRQMVKELQKLGIHAVLTKPKSLTVNVINKYLEFKAKGLI